MGKSFNILKPFRIFVRLNTVSMRREIVAYGSYYKDFMATLHDKERRKVLYILSLLENEERLPTKFIKHLLRGLHELRIKYEGNIYRIFFIFDDNKIIVLFNGFQKKTQKTPRTEVERAIKIMEDYYAYKRRNDNEHQQRDRT